MFRTGSVLDSWDLSVDEIAGWALEEDVESRLISQEEGAWKLRHGPFTDEMLRSLPQSHWTLLIQALDLLEPQAAALLQAADFLPSWRRDDLMVSLAAPGGGVGPHIDQYDVFLVQIEGEREWRVAPPVEGLCQTEVAPDLWQVSPFETELCYQCKPGDVLYIPPRWRHWGTARTLSMTASIGFRAPDLAQIYASLFEEHQEATEFFSDSSRSASSGSRITREDIHRLQSLLQQDIDNDALLARVLGKLVTIPRAEPERQNNLSGFDSGYYAKAPEARFAWYLDDEEQPWVFVNGETHRPGTVVLPWLDRWSLGEAIDIEKESLDSQSVEFLTTLLLEGCIYPVDK
jgi:50S ribosomal protein L16 3-hydroxylase